mmetsp:Transcript_136708/g.308868  ORF Transcript_136708/g.308868 Transcript_136708/m.308868 type:complete len:283 (-) Transcript_136708:851-1699(-)
MSNGYLQATSAILFLSTVTNSHRVRHTQVTGASQPTTSRISPTFHSTDSPKNPGASSTRASILSLRGLGRSLRGVVMRPLCARWASRLRSRRPEKKTLPASSWQSWLASRFIRGSSFSSFFAFPCIHRDKLLVGAVEKVPLPREARLTRKMCTLLRDPVRRARLMSTGASPAVEDSAAPSREWISSRSVGSPPSLFATGRTRGRRVLTRPLVRQNMVSTISPTAKTMSALCINRVDAKKHNSRRAGVCIQHKNGACANTGPKMWENKLVLKLGDKLEHSCIS